MIQRIIALGWTGFLQLLRSRIYINLLAVNVSLPSGRNYTMMLEALNSVGSSGNH